MATTAEGVEDKMFCDECKREILPTAAFIELQTSHRKTLRQIRNEHDVELQTLKAKYTADIEGYVERIKVLDVELQGEKRIHERVTMEYEIKMAELYHRIEELEGKEYRNDEHINLIAALKKENGELKERLAGMSEHIKEKERKIDMLTSELEKVVVLKEEIEQLTALLSEKERELITVKEESEKINKRADFYVKEVANFKQELDKLRVENDGLASSNHEHALTINDLNLKLQSVPKVETAAAWPTEKIELEKQRRIIETQVRMRFETLQRLEVQKLEADHEQRVAELRAKYEKEIDELKDDYQRDMFKLQDPMGVEFITSNIDKLTSAHLADGAHGLAAFIHTIMIENDTKANYICVDMDRLKFKYFAATKRWETDKGCVFLKKVLYPSIKEKCQRILADLKEVADRDDKVIGAVMNSVNKIEKEDKAFHAEMVNYLAPLLSVH